MVRDRFIQESVYSQAARSQPVHEEPRPGSVPPGMVHHLEEMGMQQQQQANYMKQTMSYQQLNPRTSGSQLEINLSVQISG